MATWFFGDLSPFQVIVAAVALLTGAHTVYTLFAKPKLKLFLSDSIGIVVPPREIASKFHIGCNLINPGSKVGALHRLEATVLDPRKQLRQFEWNLFFEYARGGAQVRKTADPFSIAVAPRSNVFQLIEFKLAENEKIDLWPEGSYEFKIVGWVNRRDRSSSPNIAARFHIEVDRLLSMGLQGTGQSVDAVTRVPMLEWRNSNRRGRLIS